MKMIRNDISPQTMFPQEPTTSQNAAALDFYGLDLQQTKDKLYKDMPSSSKNYYEGDNYKFSHKMLDGDAGSSSKSNKKFDLLNDSRRSSDSGSQKNNPQTAGRFKTTLVTEDRRASATESKSSNNNEAINDSSTPVVTKANNKTVKAGFNVDD